MTTEQHEEHKQHTFDCFCKRSLKYEAYNAYREIRRRQERQVNFSELLSEFHMVYHEAVLYIRDVPEGASTRAILLTLWKMFSEIEQTECLIQMNAVPPEKYGDLDTVAASLQELIYPPRPSLNVIDTSSFGQGDISYVLEHYLANARKLTGEAVHA